MGNEEERVQLLLEDEVRLEVVGFVRSQAGTRAAPHEHPFWELIYICRGGGEHILGDKLYPSAEKEFFLVPPGVRHGYLNSPRGETSKLYLGFSASGPDTRRIMERKGCHLSDDELFRLKFEAISERIMRENEVSLRREERMMLLSLLPEILRRALPDDDDRAGQSRQGALVEKIRRYLKSNRNRTVTVAEVAAALYLSPHYVGDVFRDATGMSMKEYHTALQMEYALRLIKETQLTVSEIAGRLGYSGIHYFSRKFSEYYHLPPSFFRAPGADPHSVET